MHILFLWRHPCAVDIDIIRDVYVPLLFTMHILTVCREMQDGRLDACVCVAGGVGGLQCPYL